jgi:xylose isomerase
MKKRLRQSLFPAITLTKKKILYKAVNCFSNYSFITGYSTNYGYTNLR